MRSLVFGVAITVFIGADPRLLSGHGSEARYVEVVPWTRPRIAQTYAMSYTELGIGASRAQVHVRTIAGAPCVAGAVVGFDVDDRYAFDIDEPVAVTLTYAPAYSKPFTIYWDANGGEGLGRASVNIEPGAPLRRVTVTLDRARFAGQGTRGVDLAVAAPGGALALCDIEITRSGTTRTPGRTGRLQLEVRDRASGRSVPARVGLYDETGRLPLPSDQAVLVTTGALYPALHRLERRGLVRAEWRASENNRRAKYYALTAAGRRQLESESESWERLSAAVAAIMAAS